MKRVKNFFLKSGLLMMAMGMALVSCNEEDINGTENGGKEEPQKAAAVTLEYTNVVTKDMLQYCDIVLEYNDGSGAKTEIVTDTMWVKSFTANLPCTYTFSKKVTLKEGIDMTSVEKVKILKNGHIRSYTILDAEGNSMKKGEVLSNIATMTTSCANFLAGIEKGSFNTTNTYEFDAAGKLK